MNIFSDPLSPWRLPWRRLYPANWCVESFREQLAYLENHPELRGRGNLLSDNAGKLVWKVELPGDNGPRIVACKLCQGKKPWRYVLNLSHPAREWRNYQAIYRLGIPAAEVLAYGETRRGWKLESSFIVTEFIADTRDGRDFMPGGVRRDDLPLRGRFCELVAPHLAKLHRHGFFHKALHSRNILYRGETSETLEVFFIDVARCRIRPRRLMSYPILFDLYTFLRDLALPAEESLAFIACYLGHYPDCPFTGEQLEKRLRAFRRHREYFDVIGG